MIRFLIVDDDQSILDYLRTVLGQYGLCDVALSGEVAMHLFRESLEEERPYRAVFMDILMPGMDGHEAISKLRDIEREYGRTEVDAFKLVMITSLVDNANVSKAFFQGQASCYLVKPFERERMIDELKVNGII